jgi:hypothetical protein
MRRLQCRTVKRATGLGTGRAAVTEPAVGLSRLRRHCSAPPQLPTHACSSRGFAWSGCGSACGVVAQACRVVCGGQERVRADRRGRTAGTGSSAARAGLSATRRFVIESALRAQKLPCRVGRHVHLPRLAGKRESACTVADNGSWLWGLSCSGARASRRMGKKQAARLV